MKDDARFDSLVSTALREELETPPPDHTQLALQRVLARSRRPSRAPTWLVGVAAAAAVAAVVLAQVFLRPDVAPGPASPPSLVGEWTREVRVAADPEAEGSWALRLEPDGVARIIPPRPVEGGDGASYAVGENTLRVDAFANGSCNELPAGSYRWSVTSSTLQLVPEEEPCTFRRSVFSGEWLRAGP